MQMFNIYCVFLVNKTIRVDLLIKTTRLYVFADLMNCIRMIYFLKFYFRF